MISREERLREELVYAFKNRAIIYWLVYDELCREIGPQRAEEVLKRAIYRRGQQRSEKYRPFAPDNFEGLRDAFVGGLADEGRLFQPEVERCDAGGFDLKFHACPLRDAWEEIGLSDEQVATMCRIASVIDDGTFEGAGFEFFADTWQPGGEGCCRLHVRPPKPGG